MSDFTKKIRLHT